jgi:hypothetical protein
MADYVTTPSVLQLEAVHLIISVEELSELSSEALVIACLGREIEVSLSELLGISLEEVRAHCFNRVHPGSLYVLWRVAMLRGWWRNIIMGM